MIIQTPTKSFVLILLVSGLIWPPLSSAQGNKWSLDLISGISLYSYKRTTTFDHKIKNDLGYAGGGILKYSLSERSGIGVGAKWQHIRYDIEYEYTFLDLGDPSIPVRSDIRADLLSVPVIYELLLYSGEKVIVPSSVGISTSLLLSHRDETIFEDNSTGSLGMLPSILINPHASVGMGYYLKKSFLLKIGFQFTYFPIDLISTMEPHTFSFQPLIGASYEF